MNVHNTSIKLLYNYYTYKNNNNIVLNSNLAKCRPTRNLQNKLTKSNIIADIYILLKLYRYNLKYITKIYTFKELSWSWVSLYSDFVESFALRESRSRLVVLEAIEIRETTSISYRPFFSNILILVIVIIVENYVVFICLNGFVGTLPFLVQQKVSPSPMNRSCYNSESIP